MFCVCAEILSAQNTYIKNEIELAYGVGTAPEIPDAVSRSFFDADKNHTPIDNIAGTGGFAIAYNRFVTKRLSLGLTGVYTKNTITYKVPAARLDWAIFTVLANVKYNYVYDPLFHLYSGVSAGISMSNVIGAGTGNNQVLAYHLRLIGARLGAKFGAFAELGFGYEGILKAGVSLHF